MSHKTLVKIAAVMIIVFGLTTILYPMLFNPDDKSKVPVAVPPVAVPAAPAAQ